MAARSQVAADQRLFSLVLALVVSPNGVTKRDLLRSVFGYEDRYVEGGDNQAIERQFERDKESLRALGIQVQVSDSPFEQGNNQLSRYSISKDQLQFPADLRFDNDELALLRLAAIAWREGSLSQGARRAVMKLEALGSGLDVQHLGVAPRLGPLEAGAAQLQAAIDAGVETTFDYTLPGRDSALTRKVAPLALHRAHGRWHLLAWDLERDAGRVFLLSRISGQVKPSRKAFAASLRAHAPALAAELEALADKQVATLSVRAGSVAEARLGGQSLAPADFSADAADAAEAHTVEVSYLDPHLFAAELVEYGPDAAVLAPESLRSLVIAALEGTLERHTGAAAAAAAVTLAPETTAARGATPAATSSADRVVLLMSLIGFLRERGGAPVTEIAERFDVPAAEIRDLVMKLVTAGVPGETNTYQPEDLFDIDWDAFERDDEVWLTQVVAVDDAPRFAAPEIAALLAGLGALIPVLPASEAERAERLAAKVAAALGAGDDAISVTPERADPKLRLIIQALSERARLSFGYRAAAGERTEREVVPLALEQRDAGWYLSAHCLERDALRSFRVAQMSELAIHAHQAGDPDPAPMPRTSERAFELIARVPEAQLGALAEFAPRVIEAPAEGEVRVAIDAWHESITIKLLRIAPGAIEIEAPASARSAAAEWARRALSAYDA